MNILKQIIKEAAELDAEKLQEAESKEVSENDILNGKVHNAHVNETEDEVEEIKETEVDNDKKVNEAFDSDQADYVRLYELSHFMDNAETILSDFGGYGFCVLRDKLQLFGLMFKGVSAEEGQETLKCHMYSYPQDGLIRGGQTFFTTSAGIKAAMQEAMTKIN